MNILHNPISRYKYEHPDCNNYAHALSKHSQKAMQVLENYHFMAGLSEQEKTNLSKNIQIKRYYHNQLIYAQNSPARDINIIISGTLQLGYLSANDKYYIDIFIPTGTIINIVPFVCEQPLVHDHIAHGETIIANIRGDIFFDIIKKSPDALYKVLKMVCIRSQIGREQRYFNTTQSLRIRLAKELLFLVEYHSYRQQGKYFLNIHLNQENFAELLRTTRQNINKEFAWFSENGILEVKYNSIHILDYDKLKYILNSRNSSLSTQFI